MYIFIFVICEPYIVDAGTGTVDKLYKVHRFVRYRDIL